MPPLIIGVVAGLVALYGMAGWVMSWGQGTGLLVTGLVATAVLTATAIGSAVSGASAGINTTLGLFRWLLIAPILGSATMVMLTGRVTDRDALEVACSVGIAVFLLIPEMLWLRKRSDRRQSERDAHETTASR